MSRRPIWFDAALVFFGLTLLYVATATYAGNQMNDAASAFTSAWSVTQHGTLDMSVSPAPKVWYVEVDGELLSDRMPGIIGWAIPFYAVLGRTPTPTSFPAGVAAATATGLAMSLLFCVFARLSTRRIAAVAAVLVGLSTSTWTVSAHTLWPHGIDQMWLAALLLAAGSQRWWAAGLASAAAIVTRPPLAISSAVLGARATWRARSPRPAATIGVIAVLGLVALVVYNWTVFGQAHLYVGSYERVARAYTGDSRTADAFDWRFLLENLAGALVSPARGLFAITPALLLLVPGVGQGWRFSPGWVRDSALAGLAASALQLATVNFSGGSGFYGYRYTLEALTLCSPFLLMCWLQWTSEFRWRRLTFFSLCGFGIWANVASLLSPPAANTSEGKAWHHYQLSEAVLSLGAVDRSLLSAVGVVLALAVWQLERRYRQHEAMTGDNWDVRECPESPVPQSQ